MMLISIALTVLRPVRCFTDTPRSNERLDALMGVICARVCDAQMWLYHRRNR